MLKLGLGHSWAMRVLLPTAEGYQRPPLLDPPQSLWFFQCATVIEQKEYYFNKIYPCKLSKLKLGLIIFQLQ